MYNTISNNFNKNIDLARDEANKIKNMPVEMIGTLLAPDLRRTQPGFGKNRWCSNLTEIVRDYAFPKPSKEYRQEAIKKKLESNKIKIENNCILEEENRRYLESAAYIMMHSDLNENENEKKYESLFIIDFLTNYYSYYITRSLYDKRLLLICIIRLILSDLNEIKEENYRSKYVILLYYHLEKLKLCINDYNKTNKNASCDPIKFDVYEETDYQEENDSREESDSNEESDYSNDDDCNPSIKVSQKTNLFLVDDMEGLTSSDVFLYVERLPDVAPPEDLNFSQDPSFLFCVNIQQGYNSCKDKNYQIHLEYRYENRVREVRSFEKEFIKNSEIYYLESDSDVECYHAQCESSTLQRDGKYNIIWTPSSSPLFPEEKRDVLSYEAEAFDRRSHSRGPRGDVHILDILQVKSVKNPGESHTENISENEEEHAESSEEAAEIEYNLEKDIVMEDKSKNTKIIENKPKEHENINSNGNHRAKKRSHAESNCTNNLGPAPKRQRKNG